MHEFKNNEKKSIYTLVLCYHSNFEKKILWFSRNLLHCNQLTDWRIKFIACIVQYMCTFYSRQSNFIFIFLWKMCFQNFKLFFKNFFNLIFISKNDWRKNTKISFVLILLTIQKRWKIWELLMKFIYFFFFVFATK